MPLASLPYVLSGILKHGKGSRTLPSVPIFPFQQGSALRRPRALNAGRLGRSLFSNTLGALFRASVR